MLCYNTVMNVHWWFNCFIRNSVIKCKINMLICLHRRNPARLSWAQREQTRIGSHSFEHQQRRIPSGGGIGRSFPWGAGNSPKTCRAWPHLQHPGITDPVVLVFRVQADFQSSRYCFFRGRVRFGVHDQRLGSKQ